MKGAQGKKHNGKDRGALGQARYTQVSQTHAASSSSPCNSFLRCCNFSLVRAEDKEPQRGVGTCLKSHSSKVAELEFRARSATAYSNDEKNNDNEI